MQRLLLLSILLLAFTYGCSKVTRENFERIENGMTYEEVIGVLGEPSDSSSAGFGPFSAGTAEWRDSEASISIQFLNKKVQAKSFQSHRTGEND